MKYALAAAFFVATVSAIPQTSSGGDITSLLSSIPQCAQSCATSQIGVVGQCSSDSAGLVHCLCLNKSFQSTFADCAKQSCTGANASGQCDLYTNSVKLCQGAGVDTSAIPKPDAAACPDIAGGSGSTGGGSSSGGSSSPAASSPATTSAAESRPSASASESAPAAATTSGTAPAATTSASSGTAPATNSSGTTTSPSPSSSFSSSASSVLVSGSFALFAGVAALLVL